MGTRSRTRSNKEYYHRRKKSQILKRLQSRQQSHTKLNELVGLNRLLESLILEENEKHQIKVSGYNKYCIQCKRANSKKILKCKQNVCPSFEDRYSTELIEKEPEKTET